MIYDPRQVSIILTTPVGRSLQKKQQLWIVPGHLNWQIHGRKGFSDQKYKYDNKKKKMAGL